MGQGSWRTEAARGSPEMRRCLGRPGGPATARGWSGIRAKAAAVCVCAAEEEIGPEDIYAPFARLLPMRQRERCRALLFWTLRGGCWARTHTGMD